jgi:hypothetical protein
MFVAVNICCGRVIAQDLDLNVSYQNTCVLRSSECLHILLQFRNPCNTSVTGLQLTECNYRYIL